MSGEGALQTLPFTYDRADFIALAKLGRPRIVGWLFALAWALFALAGFLIALSLIAGTTEVLPYVPVFILLLFAYLLLHRFGPDLGAWTLGWVARRNDLLREQRMTLTDDCFRAESSRGKTEVRWSAVPRIHADESRLFVYSTPHQAFVIPERAFADRKDFLAFASAARKHWELHHRL